MHPFLFFLFYFWQDIDLDTHIVYDFFKIKRIIDYCNTQDFILCVHTYRINFLYSASNIFLIFLNMQFFFQNYDRLILLQIITQLGLLHLHGLKMMDMQSITHIVTSCSFLMTQYLANYRNCKISLLYPEELSVSLNTSLFSPLSHLKDRVAL